MYSVIKEINAILLGILAMMAVYSLYASGVFPPHLILISFSIGILVYCAIKGIAKEEIVWLSEIIMDYFNEEDSHSKWEEKALIVLASVIITPGLLYAVMLYAEA